MILFRISPLAVFVIQIFPLIVLLNVDDPNWIQKCVTVIEYFIIFSWYFVVGTTLNNMLGYDDRKPDLLFKFNCFYLFVVLSLSKMLDSNTSSEGEEIPISIILLILYFIFSFFHVASFTANSYLSGQAIKRKTDIGFFYILFFLPFFGSILLHPRLKRLMAE